MKLGLCMSRHDALPQTVIGEEHDVWSLAKSMVTLTAMIGLDGLENSMLGITDRDDISMMNGQHEYQSQSQLLGSSPQTQA